MKNSTLALLLAVTVCATTSPNLLALGGNLSSPVIIIPKPTSSDSPKSLGLKPPGANQIRLFESFKEAFLGGHFINSNSWLHFTGDAETLNKMLVELARTQGVKYGVRFTTHAIPARSPFAGAEKNGGTEPRAARWTVHHDGYSNAVWITIHAGKGGIDLEKLRLPTIVKSIP